MTESSDLSVSQLFLAAERALARAESAARRDVRPNVAKCDTSDLSVAIGFACEIHRRGAIDEGGDGGRAGMHLTLKIAMLALGNSPGLKPGWDQPLIELQHALSDLNDGHQHRALTPRKVASRPEASGRQKLFRVNAAAVAQCRIAGGMSAALAYKTTARELKHVAKSYSVEISDRAVRRWRTDFNRSTKPDGTGFATRIGALMAIKRGQTEANAFAADLLGKMLS
jgi:hypothetical protein